MSKGVFISFEGGEGTGKSTQIKKLASYLKEKGQDVLITREPGGTPEAEEIRALLLKGSIEKWDAMTEALLMLASRRDHVEKLIKPSLQEGKWVLCDRFSDSSWVYQGWAGNVGIETIEALHALALGNFYPDFTLVLDFPLTEGLRRSHSRQNVETRFEEKGLSFHEKIASGYKTLLQRFPQRCHEVSAVGTEQEVFERILSTLRSFPRFSL